MKIQGDENKNAGIQSSEMKPTSELSAEFTPGPWVAHGNGVHVGIRCVAIAYDPKGMEYAPSEVALANARLIAAAPALYEAAKIAIRDGVIYELRKAVALVEGQRTSE